MDKRNNILIFNCILALCLISLSAYSQSSSVGHAPKIENPLSPFVKYSDNINYFNSRAFGYNAFGFAAPLGPFKMFLNSPVLTNLAPDPYSANFVAGASFAADGYLYGIRFGSSILVKIDTSTGTITNVGYSGPGTGMAYDWITNTMYLETYSSVSLLNKVNLSTGALTPVGQPYQNQIIDIACSNAGQLYGIDIDYDYLVSINKLYGYITPIGYIGFDANYSQGLSWDHSTDSCFYASYNNATNQCEMRRVNIQTGMTTMLYSIDAEVDGFAIPGSPGPQIVHTPLHDTENTSGPYEIRAVINPRGSPVILSQIKVYWSRNNTAITDSITMVNTGGNNWKAGIPGSGISAVYRYYITARDEFGTKRTVPDFAPNSLYLFRTGADTIKPSISHSQLQDLPRYMWPAIISAAAADNIGIDSVWVKWFINSTGNGIREFRLDSIGGNNFSADFNSDTSQVQINDSIFYRIFAEDISSNHNKDSTILYKFKIINPLQLCFIPGTISVSYPFFTFVRNARTQMLLTAEELRSVQTITKISFNVLSNIPLLMNDFNIKMQNTTLSTINTTITSGWTQVYSGAYRVPGLGWQGIVFQSAFIRDTTKNLLIDICFQDSIASTSSFVSSTEMPGKIWVLWVGGAGCSMTGSSQVTKRPDVCFDYLIGISDTGSLFIPSSFTLTQNYPNPFNPVTTIKFSVPENSFIRLSVYDLLGKKISELVNEKKTPGNYSVIFNAANLASGVYFYQIYARPEGATGEFIESKKLLLLK